MIKKKVIVIKCGGSILENTTLKKDLIKDIIFLTRKNLLPILIHGGGIQVTRMLETLGRKSRFVKGLRYTDSETLEIVEMVLSAKINKELVGLINVLKGCAVGLSGKDGAIVIARKTKEDLGSVGEVKKVNTDLLNILLKGGFIPVISSIGMTSKGMTLNINADMMAQSIAGAIKAEKLILLTDVEGVIYRGSVLNKIRISDISKLIKKGIVSRGMIPKVKACLKAVKCGVKECHIVNAKSKHILPLAILDSQERGTKIIR